MIVAEQKPLDEIKQLVSGCDKVLVLGCGTCVTVCFAGGEKEVGVLASSLRMVTRLDGIQTEFLEATVQRQCEYEYNEAIAELLPQVDAVLSIACGIGVQTMNEQYPDIQTLPGLNTTFLGSQEGVCEVDPETPCAWQEIYDRMSALGKLDLLLELNTMRDWRTSRDGGQRKIVREDLRL